MYQFRNRERDSRDYRQANWNECRHCFRTLSEDDYVDYYFVCPHCDECFTPRWIPYHWRNQKTN